MVEERPKQEGREYIHWCKGRQIHTRPRQQHISVCRRVSGLVAITDLLSLDEDGQLPSAHLESHPSAMILESDMPEWGNGYSAEVAKYESTAHYEWQMKGMLDDQTPGGPEGSVCNWQLCS